MPKKPFIPSRLMTHESQTRRNKSRLLNQRDVKYISITPQDISQNTLEQMIIEPSQGIEQIDLESHRASEDFYFKKDENSIILKPDTQSSKVLETITFQEKLARLVLNANIPRNQVTELLHLLHTVKDITELHCLPLDSRTLLNCPKSGIAPIKVIKIGEYFHLGITESLKYLLLQYTHLQQMNILQIWIAIDGIPILCNEFWPIIGGLKIDTDAILPFVIGIYCGKKKPGDVTQYLSQLIEDVNFILKNGIKLTDKIYIIKLIGFLADAPARSFLKCIKGHMAYFGCEKCTEEGCHIENRMCFPEGNATLRNDDSFRKKIQEEHHTGDSPLILIHSLGLVLIFLWIIYTYAV
ncbi:uncharacterized protein LOC126909975 [Daktulosphaira vitifoliae]|uniref:uncharacterized protein LOC126909975 n=1 Tax=Daktulosphaira vitifoliae TaxID=58002 RepID=UPI0021AA7F49|nr:uncharacterized protein LOC126909975 [Daktulosphaira vitifoliae]